MSKQLYRLPTISRYNRWALSVAHPTDLTLNTYIRHQRWMRAAYPPYITKDLPNLLIFDRTVSPAECESGRDSSEQSPQVSDLFKKKSPQKTF